MKRQHLVLLLVSLGVAFTGDLQSQDARPGQPVLDADAARAGKRLYRRRCVFCHGTKGNGDGQVSRYVFPKPRDLAAGVYKIRSTPSGELPTDQDLFDTLTRGLPGTTMPSWANLSERQRWQLVAYIKTFSPRFGAEPPAEPLAIGRRKPPLPESIDNGRRLFVEVECGACHGSSGEGNGPSSVDLTDDWGYPIVPADLRVSQNWRGGSRPRDIFRSIAVGVGGTPMPSFRDALSDDDLWDLTNFLRSIIQR